MHTQITILDKIIVRADSIEDSSRVRVTISNPTEGVEETATLDGDEYAAAMCVAFDQNNLWDFRLRSREAYEALYERAEQAMSSFSIELRFIP